MPTLNGCWGADATTRGQFDRRPVPVRIMHVIDTLGQGGLENGVVNLIQRLDPTKFEHIVCTMRKLGINQARLPADRVHVLCLGGGEQPNARVQVMPLVRAIRKAKPDIVHSRNWAGIEAVVAARWLRTCAVIHSEHGVEAMAVRRDPLRRRCFRRLSFHLADRVVTVSRQLRDLHAARTGFPAERITIIHNGVDTGRFFAQPALRARIREQIAIGPGEFCIGAVGNLFPVKDHKTLLEAVNQLHASCKSWRLLLIGDGSESGMLRSFVDGHPEWKARVAFLGSRNDVPELLNAMDVYVLPSISEGISNSLLEAMATGVPVVVTDTGGNPEVVIDGRCGLLFPVAGVQRLTQHLLALATRHDMRQQLGNEAALRVRQNFSIDAMVTNYSRLYESTVRYPRG
jgi:sugar transferase (PEP-CTERM/EpsH1 system associated)